MRLVAIFCITLSFVGFAADSPRIGAAIPLAGPQVDVTLRNGDTATGQLISFSDGNLSLKLENGSIFTQEGVAVSSVRFFPADRRINGARVLSAQETELNITEIDRLNTLRWRENPPKGLQTAKQPLAPVTEKEKAELTKLRARADLHIKALEFEMPEIDSEEAAQAKLHELGRYYFFFGLPPQEIRPMLHKAVLGIKNDAIKRKMETGMPTLWTTFVEKHKNIKSFEKVYERMMVDRPDRPAGDRPPGDRPPGDKPPTKPPPPPPQNGN